MTSGEKRQAIYAFVTRYIETEHIAPTIREIAKAVGMTSLNGVSYHLTLLQLAGLIDWQAGKPRTIRIVENEVQ